MIKILAVLVMFATVATAEAECGTASMYGNENGQWRRADGKRYYPWAIGCAYKRGRLGSVITVTSRGRSIRCPVNDRGPYVRSRILDLSLGAARALGVHGLAKVCIQ